MRHVSCGHATASGHVDPVVLRVRRPSFAAELQISGVAAAPGLSFTSILLVVGNICRKRQGTMELTIEYGCFHVFHVNFPINQHFEAYSDF